MVRRIALIVGAAWALSACSAPISEEELVEVRRASTSPAERERDELIRRTLLSANKIWTAQFARFDDAFYPVQAVLFNGGTQSECRPIRDEEGTTFCRADRKIYASDQSWLVIDREFGRTSAVNHAVIIAHEIGHNVQSQTGVYDKVMAAIEQAAPSQKGPLNAKLELQADCYAGLWFRSLSQANDPASVDEALRSRYIGGDDYRQRTIRGWHDVNEVSHGLAENRVAAFRKGMERGDPDDCGFDI